MQQRHNADEEEYSDEDFEDVKQTISSPKSDKHSKRPPGRAGLPK